jgi:hypothetical protein
MLSAITFIIACAAARAEPAVGDDGARALVLAPAARVLQVGISCGGTGAMPTLAFGSYLFFPCAPRAEWTLFMSLEGNTGGSSYALYTSWGPTCSASINLDANNPYQYEATSGISTQVTTTLLGFCLNSDTCCAFVRCLSAGGCPGSGVTLSLTYTPPDSSNACSDNAVAFGITNFNDRTIGEQCQNVASNRYSIFLTLGNPNNNVISVFTATGTLACGRSNVLENGLAGASDAFQRATTSSLIRTTATSVEIEAPCPADPCCAQVWYVWIVPPPPPPLKILI